MTEEKHTHPAFLPPADSSAVIWRYMSAQKFDWILKFSRLYFPSADCLGDPWEGTTPPAEIEWWRREADNADSDELRRIVERNRHILSRMAKKFRNQHYVSCWHMNPYESHGMWDCYAKQSESVAIRTTYAALRESLPHYVEMGVVRYIDYATQRLPTMNIFEHIMHKDVHYSFELEVRAVANRPVVDELGLADFKQSIFETEDTKGCFVYSPFVNVRRLIHGVVLHPNATRDYAKVVDELCVSSGLPAPETSRRNRKPLF